MRLFPLQELPPCQTAYKQVHRLGLIQLPLHPRQLSVMQIYFVFSVGGLSSEGGGLHEEASLEPPLAIIAPKGPIS